MGWRGSPRARLFWESRSVGFARPRWLPIPSRLRNSEPQRSQRSQRTALRSDIPSGGHKEVLVGLVVNGTATTIRTLVVLCDLCDLCGSKRSSQFTTRKRLMASNRLQELHDAGQSIWLDFIDRTMLRNGDLARRIRDDALTGMTSNPTIFEKALAEGSDVRRSDPVGAPASSRRWSSSSSSRRPTCATPATSSAACTIATNGGDGYVSIEVSPGAANDAHGDGRRGDAPLGDRRPAERDDQGARHGRRREGRAPAHRERHQRQHHAALRHRGAPARDRGVHGRARGSRRRRASTSRTSHSVASFFVSRVDTEVDKRLDAWPQGDPAQQGDRSRCAGKAAIANAKLAYKLFQTRVRRRRAGRRSRRRARSVQRPLWASTSTKNPAYRDVMYVEELIGPDT